MILNALLALSITFTGAQSTKDIDFPLGVWFEGGIGVIPWWRLAEPGSGVMIERRGNTVYVLTNNHVAGSAASIQVQLQLHGNPWQAFRRNGV